MKRFSRISGVIAGAASAMLVIAATAFVAPAAGQEPTQATDSLFELRLGDGTKHIGKVVSRTDDRIVFQSITGAQMEVNATFARLRTAPGNVVEGEYWAPDRNRSRLFFAPTARPVEPGQGYAGMFWILPFVGFGVSDDLTLAGGLPPAGELGQTPIWIAPKLRVLNSAERQVSLGMLGIYTPEEEREDVYYCDPQYDRSCSAEPPEGAEGKFTGIAYGIATFGGLDKALHLGSGVTFGGDGVKVPIMIGGENRLGRRWKLISENWVIPGDGGAGSLGVRRIGDNWTWDFGWMALFGDSDVPYFPIVSFSYSWGG